MSPMSVHSDGILCWVPGGGLLLPRVGEKGSQPSPILCLCPLCPLVLALLPYMCIHAAGAEAQQDRGSRVIQLHAIDSYRGWISGAHL